MNYPGTVGIYMHAIKGYLLEEKTVRAEPPKF
jgi:hypothetical protein